MLIRGVVFGMAWAAWAAWADSGAEDLAYASRHPVPGVVVAKSDQPDRLYLASPSLARLDDGELLVAHDWSGPGAPPTTTSVYSSRDDGQTWTRVGDAPGIRWATLFEHRDALYLFGVAKSFGDVAICRSVDRGRTWTKAEDGATGLLARGKFHTGPVPVVVADGRIWRAFEEAADPRKKRAFETFVMSAPEEADLLDEKSWTRTNGIPFDPAWLNIKAPEWIEGNVVVGPGGELRNLLRTNTHPREGDAHALSGGAAGLPRYEVVAAPLVSRDGRRLTFDPETDFRHFPGAQSKFTIRFDPVSQLYWAIAQKITARTVTSDWTVSPHHQRNVLIVVSSPDLRRWTERSTVLSYKPGMVMTKENRIGFQYPDWIFAGDDLLMVSRTAWGGANYHDANCITFHRVKNFRALPQPAPIPVSLP